MPEPGRPLELVSVPARPWTVAHETRNRLRLRVDALKQREDRCAAVRDRLRAIEGVRSVHSTPRLGTLTIRYAPQILERRRLEGHLLAILAALSDQPRESAEAPGRRERVDTGELGLLALALAATPLLPLPARYAITAGTIAPSIWKALAELRTPGAAGGVQDAAALSLATLAGRYGTAQVSNFLHRLARYLEQEAVGQVEAGLRRQVRPPGGSFLVRRGQRELRCSAQELLAGDCLHVHGGSALPLQGMLLSADGTVTTGSDGATRQVTQGAILATGTRVDGEPLEVALLQDWCDGSYHRLQAFVETVIRERQGAEASGEGVSERLAAYTLLISSAVFGFTRSLRRTSSTLQADFGAALGLVTPVAVETAIASAAAGGILFRGGTAIERLARADCFVFDKTGTLSDSNWHLGAVFARGERGADRAHEALSLVVLGCLRPRVATALEGRALPPVTTLTHHEAQEITAHGLQLGRGERRLSLVTLEQARERLDVKTGSEVPPVSGSQLGLCLLEDGVVLAEFVFFNPPAPGAAALLEDLRRAGIPEIHMITHEREGEIPPELGALDLDGIHPGLDEFDKQAFIAGLEARGRRVVLISDGLFKARGDCLTVCLAASPDYRQLDADVWLLWPDLAGIASAHRIAREAAQLLESNQRGNLLGNGAVLLAASFDLISSTTAAVVSNAITLGLLHRAREPDGGPLP